MEPPIAPGESFTFTVIGEPKPGGSKTAQPVYKGGRPLMKNGRPVIATRPDNPKTRPWMNSVAETAVHEWGPREECAVDGPVFLELDFYFPRPDGHYGTGRNAGKLKPSAPLWPARGGYDTDKLVRAVLDALQGIVFTNDRRVVKVVAERKYGAPARCTIKVSRPAWSTNADVAAAHEPDEASEEPQLALA
jgi:Holliday junction resolvase RusA-like endonuclease